MSDARDFATSGMGLHQEFFEWLHILQRVLVEDYIISTYGTFDRIPDGDSFTLEPPGERPLRVHVSRSTVQPGLNWIFFFMSPLTAGEVAISQVGPVPGNFCL